MPLYRTIALPLPVRILYISAAPLPRHVLYDSAAPLPSGQVVPKYRTVQLGRCRCRCACCRTYHMQVSRGRLRLMQTETPLTAQGPSPDNANAIDHFGNGSPTLVHHHLMNCLIEHLLLCCGVVRFRRAGREEENWPVRRLHPNSEERAATMSPEVHHHLPAAHPEPPYPGAPHLLDLPVHQQLSACAMSTAELRRLSSAPPGPRTGGDAPWWWRPGSEVRSGRGQPAAGTKRRPRRARQASRQARGRAHVCDRHGASATAAPCNCPTLSLLPQPQCLRRPEANLLHPDCGLRAHRPAHRRSPTTSTSRSWQS